MKVLVVDDDPAVTESLKMVLSMEGYEVCVRDTATGCLAQARAWRPDLVLLDIMMPGEMTGLDVLRIMRRETDLPVILISARHEEAYKVIGLEYADDYLVKPFKMPEMLGRVRAVLRRARSQPERRPAVEAGSLRIDRETREVTINGELVAVTPKEYDLLLTLASHPGRVFTRDELTARVWGPDEYVDPRTIGVHIGSLRRKLGRVGARPSPIATVRGVGFRFVS